MISQKNILIAPLDWGLGHASRCVPLIKELSKNNRIIIGSTPLNRDLFKSYFPSHTQVELPSYAIRYSAYAPAWLKILLQSQSIKAVIAGENKTLQQLVKQHALDVVISDNRFGLYHSGTENIFITHQLNIQSPMFSALANRINRNYIHRFNRLWVPDYEAKDQRLSGRLSDADEIKIPVEYIGPQSALQIIETGAESTHTIDYLLLLSGAEPQRSILEMLLVEKFRDAKHKVVLVRGTHTGAPVENGNIQVINTAYGEELRQLILSAGSIVCRSGYSTLMDLHLLGKKKLILIPTPGQTEQEYLASYWRNKFLCTIVKQKDISQSSIGHSPTV